ncbi:hypothetical protein RJ639_041345 [Escallonia herrerae]|uniref:Exostosin GT47 domain-containing protein n=1 Tax=Escallonia herrerae TaxID=1293975 RepID=A0AA88WFU8_9ASTE|nr:hypothetical protein RJ639_041345 [Escallonia herrerae]
MTMKACRDHRQKSKPRIRARKFCTDALAWASTVFVVLFVILPFRQNYTTLFHASAEWFFTESTSPLPSNNTIHLVEGSTKLVPEQPSSPNMVTEKPASHSCTGRYVYVHDLPSRYNDDIVRDCFSLNRWFNMCDSLSNMGLGPRAENSNKFLQDDGWFVTNQFALEVIFRNRMRQYECLTNDSSLASAIYVPYYPGLDVGRYLWGGYNTSLRDSNPLDLVQWLTEKPEWNYMRGRDHFFVTGRITWDFRRESETNSGWGNKLLKLPVVENMTVLGIESSLWSQNEVAIPYPTYFHPSSATEVFEWQNTIRRQKRRYLFSFVGAPRPDDIKSIRGKIIHRCIASRECQLLDCNKFDCMDPVNVIQIFRSSAFCLQPPGDSYTRRSTFDSILAGCIPVFFHPGSAYNQYKWHLPKNSTKYSVFIPEQFVLDGKADIEKILHGISEERVTAMSHRVIKLIPRIIYADPRSRLDSLEDAFDIALKRIIQNVNKIPREASERKK